MTTSTRGLAETFVRMLNEHEPDLVERFVAPDYRNHNAFVGDGREANRRFWGEFFTALPDLTATMEDLVIAGDRVVGRFVYRGTHTGEFMGIAPTGRSVEMRSIDIWRVENEMFVEHWDELNTLQLLTQMGALPAVTGGEAVGEP
jgi:predicted ester cyclase